MRRFLGIFVLAFLLCCPRWRAALIVHAAQPAARAFLAEIRRIVSDWQEQFRGWSDPERVAHPASPSGGGGPGGFTSPGPVGLYPSRSAPPGLSSPLGVPLGPIPHPRSPASRHFDWPWLPVRDVIDRAQSLLEAITRAPAFLPEELLEATGEELHSVIAGMVEGLLMSLGIVAATSLGGAVAGGAIGFFAGGGAGAAPGAVAGSELGLDLGIWLLEYLGLGSLIMYVGKTLLDAIEDSQQAFRMAWHAVDAGAGADGQIDLAAHRLARAVADIFRGILQGIVAYLLSKGLSAAQSRLGELVANLRKSRPGRGFADWVEANWQRLLKNKKLQPDAAQTSGKGSGPGEKGARVPAGGGGGSAAPPPPPSRGTGAVPEEGATASSRPSTAGTPRVVHQEISDPNVSCGSQHPWEGSGAPPKWGNPKSIKAYDHAESEHGPKRPAPELWDRMKGTGNAQGQWYDPKDWVLAEQAAPQNPGRYVVDLGKPVGRVYRTDGTITEGVTRAYVQRDADGTLVSTYPVDDTFPFEKKR
jgi:hypothetical protein